MGVSLMESLSLLFDRTLDEIYPSYNVKDIVYLPSEILRNCDPVFYKQLYLDWLDQQPKQIKDSIEEEYYLE